MSSPLVATALSRGVLFAAQLDFAAAGEMLEFKREHSEIVRDDDDWVKMEVRAIQKIADAEKVEIEIFIGVYGETFDCIYYYVKRQ